MYCVSCFIYIFFRTCFSGLFHVHVRNNSVINLFNNICYQIAGVAILDLMNKITKFTIYLYMTSKYLGNFFPPFVLLNYKSKVLFIKLQSLMFMQLFIIRLNTLCICMLEHVHINTDTQHNRRKKNTQLTFNWNVWRKLQCTIQMHKWILIKIMNNFGKSSTIGEISMQICLLEKNINTNWWTVLKIKLQALSFMFFLLNTKNANTIEV